MLNLVLLFEISYGNLSKNSFGVCLPGVFSRLASAKVQTFLITKKPFPYFSYKKVDFYQKTAGYTIYNIYRCNDCLIDLCHAAHLAGVC